MEKDTRTEFENHHRRGFQCHQQREDTGLLRGRSLPAEQRFHSLSLRILCQQLYEQLGTIIGEAVEDDLVNEIFSKFCMGK